LLPDGQHSLSELEHGGPGGGRLGCQQQQQAPLPSTSSAGGHGVEEVEEVLV
jgi:hypothetical protein